MRRSRAWGVWCLILPLLFGCGARRSVPYTLEPGEKVRGVYHVVERKQTLWRIAKAYGVDLQHLAEINDIEDVTQIYVGQRIFIPGATRPLKVKPYIPPPHGPPEPSPEVRTFRGQFIWPVEGTITSSYGVRNGIKHAGIDIAAPQGTPVRAAGSGKVVYRGRLRGYGRILILKHSRAYTTVYAHLKEWRVRDNQRVERGDPIAAVGDSGKTSGPHLHFEIRAYNQARNPLFYLPKRSSRR